MAIFGHFTKPAKDWDFYSGLRITSLLNETCEILEIYSSHSMFKITMTLETFSIT